MSIVLTDDGKDYADQVLSELYKKEASVFRKLSADDRKVIDELEKIVEYLKGETL